MEVFKAGQELKELRSAGHRLTKLRVALVEIVASFQKPMLLEEMNRFLRQRGISVHRATLYREIDFLEKQNILVPVVLPDDKKRFEFAHREHHHHLVCTECRVIEEIEINDDLALQEELIAQEKHFSVVRHSLEFFGICGSCQRI